MRGDRGLCRAAIEYGIEPRPIRFVAAPLREVIKGSAASLGAGRRQIESGAILRMRKHLRMNLTAHKLLVAPDRRKKCELRRITFRQTAISRV